MFLLKDALWYQQFSQAVSNIAHERAQMISLLYLPACFVILALFFLLCISDKSRRGRGRHTGQDHDDDDDDNDGGS